MPTLEVQAVPALPLVLVVEDDDQARELRGSSLSTAGMAVIPVPDRESALACLRDGPAVDLIVTDIDLGNGDERGGLELARTVLSGYDADVPVVAYSGRYYDEDLSAEDIRLFRLHQTKGQLSRRRIVQFERECFELANEHRSKRLRRSTAAKEAQSRLGSATVTKQLTLTGSFDEIENALASLNYELRLISSDAFKALASTVAVWMRIGPDAVEVQVCGQPYLHWSAPAEREAIEGLVHVMVGYASDLVDSPRSLSPDLIRLRSYLAQVVEHGAILDDE